MHDPSIKAGVRKLRKNGRTFSEILVEFPFLSKSTISEWVSGIELKPEQEKRIIQKQLKGRWLLMHINRKRHKDAIKNAERIMLKAKNEIGKITKRELLILGTALYWAEGTRKSRNVIKFCNSDTKMIILMMKFFRDICQIKESKFKCLLTLPSSINQKTALKFWSSVTKVPLTQFYKVSTRISKTRTGKVFNDNYKGTLQIQVCDTDKLWRIQGLIMGLS